jgi:hypothetical protein
VEKEMRAWLETKPKKNEENDKKHASFVKRMSEFQQALDEIIKRQK